MISYFKIGVSSFSTNSVLGVGGGGAKSNLVKVGIVFNLKGVPT